MDTTLEDFVGVGRSRKSIAVVFTESSEWRHRSDSCFVLERTGAIARREFLGNAIGLRCSVVSTADEQPAQQHVDLAKRQEYDDFVSNHSCRLLCRMLWKLEYLFVNVLSPGTLTMICY